MRRSSGFSLMEMMVVLLIVAIIAAASAPMISKKSLSAAAEKSPWVWTKGGSIAYNLAGNDQTAVIGGVMPPFSKDNPLLYLKTGSDKPQLTLGGSGGADSFLNIMSSPNGTGIGFSNALAKPSQIGDYTISIGSGAKASVARAIAIGGDDQYQTGASAARAIAIGSAATASKESSIALGASAYTEGASAISLGAGANVKGDKGIAIGKDSSANGGVAIGDTVKTNGGVSIGYGRPVDAPSSFGSIAIGGQTVATGQLSTAVGTTAKATNLYSTALGWYAKATGSNATAIGPSTTATHSNSVAIGPGAYTRFNNEIVLGGGSTTVYIPGNLVVDKVAILNTSRSGSGVWLGAYNAQGWIGEHGNDNCRLNENTSTSALGTIGRSDRRLKNVGKAFVGGLEEIKKLEVFNYTFKKDPAKTPHVGVMAQDLQKIFPNAVFKGDDGFLRIRMEDMFYALVNAVKELDRKIEEFKTQEIITLKNRVDKLEKENKALEKRLSELEKKVK